MTEEPSVKTTSLDRGLELLRKGNPRAALQPLRFVADQKPVTDETVRAMYWVGIALAQQGAHVIAAKRLRDARTYLSESNNIHFKATMLRSLGSAFQTAGLRRKSEKMLLDDAFECFAASQSILLNALSTASKDGSDSHLFDAEFNLTTGFMGMWQYETGHREHGIEVICIADTTLQELGEAFDAYQFESVILVMRTTSLWGQREYIDRAFELASKSSKPFEARNRVWAAILGNRSYRFFMKNGIHSTDC